jgi:hypothetical protein
MPPSARRLMLGLLLALAGQSALAYTAAGDREFAATILLPQIGPADELYLTGASQPVDGGRGSSFSATYDKTITERFGIGFTEGYGVTQTTGQPSVEGWQNLTVIAQYTPVIDQEHEFLLSVGFEREMGDTGALHAGADTNGATTPLVYFGKGLGEIGPDLLKPIAIVGNVGTELGDGARPNLWTGGLAIEYSMPYLSSKIAGVTVPDALRSLIPMIEIAASTPMKAGSGETTSAVVAPGITYSGQFWELGLEAQIPVTRAAGQGLGVALQLHIALDYLYPETLGTPLFGGE